MPSNNILKGSIAYHLLNITVSSFFILLFCLISKVLFSYTLIFLMKIDEHNVFLNVCSISKYNVTVIMFLFFKLTYIQHHKNKIIGGKKAIGLYHRPPLNLRKTKIINTK